MFLDIAIVTSGKSPKTVPDISVQIISDVDVVSDIVTEKTLDISLIVVHSLEFHLQKSI